jgi:hypothetical protein
MNGWRWVIAGIGFWLVSFSAMSEEKKDLPKQVYKHWIHSHEEDQGDVKVFRPQGYEFPPSRGRAGFEIRQDGVFIDHPIAPADGNESIPGKWENLGSHRLKVMFPKHPDRSAFVLEIISCDGQTLKLKRKPGK